MNQNNSLRARIWLALARFCWRRLKAVSPDGKVPDGVPGIRDADCRCPAYSPSRPIRKDWFGCHGDGHYLCPECCHYAPVEEEVDA